MNNEVANMKVEIKGTSKGLAWNSFILGNKAY